MLPPSVELTTTCISNPRDPALQNEQTAPDLLPSGKNLN